MGLAAAVAFLTPFGGARMPRTAAVAWFGVVGALQGLAVGVVWWAGQEAFPVAVAAALALLADLVVTGILHLDGLADTADGVLPVVPRERRLEIMATPDVGAFGVAAVGTVLLARFAALASVEADAVGVAALWAAARAAMGVSLLVMPSARPAGLTAAFRAGPPRERTAALAAAAASIVVAVAVAPLAEGWQHAAALIVAMVAFALVVAGAARRLGGVTGDVLGAAGVVAETAGLVAFTASW